MIASSILGLLGALALLAGVVMLVLGKGAATEISGLILLLIAAVCTVGSAIVDQVRALRRELRQVPPPRARRDDG